MDTRKSQRPRLVLQAARRSCVRRWHSSRSCSRTCETPLKTQRKRCGTLLSIKALCKTREAELRRLHLPRRAGGPWGGSGHSSPPMLSQLAQLRQKLELLQPHLGRDESIRTAARLCMAQVGLSAYLESLNWGLQELEGESPETSKSTPKSEPKLEQKSAPRWEQRSALRSEQRWAPKKESKSESESAPKSDLKLEPKSDLEQLRQQIQKGRRRVLQQCLRFLIATSRECCVQLHSAQEEGALLSRVAGLKQELHQGMLCVHRRAGLGLGEGPEPEQLPLPHPEGMTELVPQLQLVRDCSQQQIMAWPQLEQRVSQWWTQPAQWTLATPPSPIGCSAREVLPMLWRPCPLLRRPCQSFSRTHLLL
ncbi:uncharacterized protein LOC134054298 isoform X2 [Cinclus cinclus]|uniref:uncharacterized protein LOC134054298 isoform X2 n=1 Tax=Cinclus cinclus TaxID=127875 RepID=UPI002E13475D